jgi:hypothetical protein
MIIEKLPQDITMQLYLLKKGADDLLGIKLFSSSKKWLHPLFELEEFLNSHAKSNKEDSRTFEFDGHIIASSRELFLRDRIIGRAAAFLIMRMGISRVETDLVSKAALAVLKEHHIPIETLDTVDAIACMTEHLLEDISNPDEAYHILQERRAKAIAKNRT